MQNFHYFRVVWLITALIKLLCPFGCTDLITGVPVTCCHLFGQSRMLPKIYSHMILKTPMKIKNLVTQ